MSRKFYAHSKNGEPPENRQLLEEHLKNVADMAREFAGEFKAEEWGYLAGLWHDLGKYSREFQERITALHDRDAHIESVLRPDHSTAGAQHANAVIKQKGKLIAYTIAGHHAGIPDGISNENSCLSRRLDKSIPDYSDAPSNIKNQFLPCNLPFDLDHKRACFQLSFFSRMLYSSLVDADFLDTEKFMEPEKPEWRKGYPDLCVLDKRLTRYLETLAANAPSTSINRHRKEILDVCLSAADRERGLFSLTVPTGGGKTLASLAFALKHAKKHNLRRIIYVIPYTSIIEQNAAVFRKVLGDEAVLEHHSNYEPREEDHRSRLSSDNWDAPLIVTTNVQFFESLFGNRSSVCRKLHRIARSVVILDEAQMLPVPLLKPCMEVIRELSSSAYGTSMILCTATQPSLARTQEFKDGLEGVSEIITNPEELYKAFKRTDMSYLHSMRNDELAENLLLHEQVLCIVNTRRHARQLYERINHSGNCFHLSALMCPAHRTAVFKKIRDALAGRKPCRVVSTQLVEAGVDIDFPVVYRSISGIDSIAQAAGRCNREGKLPHNGQVFVFYPEAGLPPGYFRVTAETAQEVMRHYHDALSLDAVEEYFRTLYWRKGDKLDELNILQDLSEGSQKGDYPFRRIARKFKIIRDGMISIIIPFNKEAEKIIGELRFSEIPGAAARKLQRFTIQVPSRVLAGLLSGGAIERLHDQYNILINRDIYRDDLGLCPEDPSFHEIENLIT